eukprot:jgi/Mesvir1/20395/Mv12298-RA.1
MNPRVCLVFASLMAPGPATCRGADHPPKPEQPDQAPPAVCLTPLSLAYPLSLTWPAWFPFLELGLTVACGHATADLNDQIHQAVLFLSREGDVVKRHIMAMMHVNEEMAADLAHAPPGASGTAALRIRVALATAVSRKFADVMEEFAMMRAHIREDHREVVRRQLVVITGEAPESAVVDEILDKGDDRNLLKAAVLQQGKEQIMDVLQEMRDRREGMQEIEKGMLDLQQMFVDMALLVDEQGEALNDIEVQVEGTADYAHRGVQELVKSRRLAKSIRRKLFCLCFLLLVIIAIIVIYVLVKFL